MNRFWITLALLLLVECSTALADSERVPLEPVDDTLLVDFLTRSEQILEWHHIGIAKMYRISEGPLTCEGTPESCPRQRLFISTIIPDLLRNGYLSPAAFGWKDPKVVRLRHEQIGFTIIEVQEEIIGADPGTRRFDTRTRRIYVEEHETYMQ